MANSSKLIRVLAGQVPDLQPGEAPFVGLEIVEGHLLYGFITGAADLEVLDAPVGFVDGILEALLQVRSGARGCR
jgi:hypothetical protein